jgi:hypothetical protein
MIEPYPGIIGWDKDKVSLLTGKTGKLIEVQVTPHPNPSPPGEGLATSV